MGGRNGKTLSKGTKKVRSLGDISSSLQERGYRVSIGGNSEYINVNGTAKGASGTNYFNAKAAKAKSIVEGLKSQGFDARAEKHYDGFYDIKVYPS